MNGNCNDILMLFQLTMLFHEYSDSNFCIYMNYITINDVMLTIGKGSIW